MIKVISNVITEILISPVGRVDEGNPMRWLNQRTMYLLDSVLSGFLRLPDLPVNLTYELRLIRLTCLRVTLCNTYQKLRYDTD